MDIEDAHKLKILTTADTRELLMAYFTPERRDEIHRNLSRLDVYDVNEQIVYLRSCVINALEGECVRAFVAAEQEILTHFPDEFPTWRFSPGYGDLPLALQGDFLRTLGAEKRLGVTLSAGGLCIPTKTVTAVIGLSGMPLPKGKKGCAVCRLQATCPYRAKGVHCK
jgi:hypothetical protein